MEKIRKRFRRNCNSEKKNKKTTSSYLVRNITKTIKSKVRRKHHLESEIQYANLVPKKSPLVVERLKREFTVK